MSLFEVGLDGLIAFRAPARGAAAYDQVVEDVLWANLERVLDEPLLRVRRRPQIADGSPALVALDRHGAVVVIHAGAEIDRSDLTDCLEYAGWARAASAEALAELYWRGAAEFWADWRAFAPGGVTPGTAQARLKLVTAEFAGRAGSTFDYLVDSGVPVQVIRASLYEDDRGRRLLDVRPQEELRPLDPRLGAADVAQPMLSLPAATQAATPSASQTATPSASQAATPSASQTATYSAAQTTIDLPADVLSRARAASELASLSELAGPSDPLGGEILPPLDITAEQLRNDPLGVDQIVGGRVTAVEPGTPGPLDTPLAPVSPSAPLLGELSGMPTPAAPMSGAPLSRAPLSGAPRSGAPLSASAGPREYDAQPDRAATPLGHLAEAAPAARLDGPAITRYDSPPPSIPRFEPAPGQPAAVLGAAPGQPFALAEPSGGEAVDQQATKLPGSAPDARPADVRPADVRPGGFGVDPVHVPSGSFRAPAEPVAYEPAPYEPAAYEPVAYEESTERSAAAPFPSGSFTPPAEPAPYRPYGEPFAEAGGYPSSSFTPPAEPAPFSPSAPFGSRTEAPAPSFEPPARPPHVVEVGASVQQGPESAAPTAPADRAFGQPPAFDGQFGRPAGGAPFGQSADSGPPFSAAEGQFEGRPGEIGGRSPYAAQPMSPAGLPPRSEPPSNVIPLGGRMTAPPGGPGEQHRPGAMAQSGPASGPRPPQNFSGPAFRLPGLPASPAPFGADRSGTDPDSRYGTGQAPDQLAAPQFDPLASGSFGGPPREQARQDGPPREQARQDGPPREQARQDGPPSLHPDQRGTDEIPSFGRPTSGGLGSSGHGMPGTPGHGGFPSSSDNQPPAFRPSAHQAPEAPRAEFPTGGYPRAGELGTPPQGTPPQGTFPHGTPPQDALPRRVPGGFGGGPQPPGSMRGAHADRGPQYAGFEPPEADASDRSRGDDPLDPRMLRVPDAPAWEDARGHGYSQHENGRGNH